MNLQEMKSILSAEPGKHLLIELPGGPSVPISFHITEVGIVRKTFFDCGGVLRDSSNCLLQVWVGEDEDHRITAKKAAEILGKASSLFPDESIAVEIEYEDSVISQYLISSHEVLDAQVVMKLEHKHTACLAPALCGLPSQPDLSPLPSAPCCAPGKCC